MQRGNEQNNSNRSAADAINDVNRKLNLIVHGYVHNTGEIGVMINEKTGDKFYYKKGRNNNGNF